MLKKTLALTFACLFCLALGCQTQTGTTGSGPADNAGSGTMVKLSVPNMTWAGCAVSVRDDLAKIDGVSNIKTDTSNRVCTFSFEGDGDGYKDQLSKFAESNPHLAGFSYN